MKMTTEIMEGTLSQPYGDGRYRHPTPRSFRERTKGGRLLVLLIITSFVSTTVASINREGFAYIADTDVSQILKLSLDIRDMRSTSDLKRKEKIYLQGSNALPYTLAGLSLDASQNFNDFPLYNVYKYAFYELGSDMEEDQPGYFDEHPIEEYANTLVEDLFLLNRTRIEADGALVLNVVMGYWGTLHKMLRSCEAKSAGTDLIALLDQAAALWVGEGQERYSNSQGFLLYNLAEKASTNFGQDQASGEAKVNVDVLEQYISLKSDFNNGLCADEAGYKTVRGKVQDLIRWTNIVLVQMMIHHVEYTKNSDFVELYALSILPQIAACDADAYMTLLELAVSQDVTDASKPQVIETLQQSYSCLMLECKDVGSYLGDRVKQCKEPELSLAGYLPVADVRRKSYIDRDLRHIRMFLRLGAFDAAKDYYMRGWNTYFSLHDLATNRMNLPVTSAEFSRFELFFDDDDPPNFAHNLIMAALEQKPPFEQASGIDRTKIVTGLLEGVVMYFSITSQLESAIPACENPAETSASALEYWDGGVAFYIGSMEGRTESLEPRGELIFGVAKELCIDFQTCQEEDASVNRALIDYFEFGRNALSTSQCSQALTIIQSKIKPSLLVPLLQATLYYTTKAATGADDGSLGSLWAFSRAILPAIHEASRDNAAIIAQHTDYAFGSQPDVEAIFDSFRRSLPSIPTDCRDIGVLKTDNMLRGVCEDDVPIGSPGPQAPSPSAGGPSRSPVYVPPSDPAGLAWGRYQFTNEDIAVNDSKFSLDVKDIANSEGVDVASGIYHQQSKYVPNGLSGDYGIKSLSDMSVRAIEIMKEDPLYNFYRVALYDDSDFEETQEGGKIFAYADTVVRLALDVTKGNSPQLASDAAVTMSCFMMMVHRLYETVRRCKAQDNPSTLLDSVVGLWIGQEQGQGRFNSGWMMYSQAQRASQLFGNPESESEINSELMDFFNEAQSQASSCVSDEEVFKELRKTTDNIIRLLSKVLMQHMIYYISVDDRNNAELYSLAFIPQTVACDEGTFAWLRDTLFLDFDRDSALESGLTIRLGKMLRCMRYSCEDIGNTANAGPNVKNVVSNLCSVMDHLENAGTIAGYETDNDVSELLRIDLDILQIELLMRTKAYDLALDYYNNGRNSLDTAGEPIALRSLVTASTLSQAGDIFTLFDEYFKSDTYADSLILSAIQSQQTSDQLFAGASRRQLSEAVSRTLQTFMSYMHVVSHLRMAVSSCGTSQESLRLIDEAAALFVGSIEGPAIGGDIDRGGKLLFALGKETCGDFRKCESHEDSAANEFILVSLQDMKRSISSGDCRSALSIVDDVVNMLPVPLVQGTLSLAVSNAVLEAKSEDKSLATGFVISSAILPLVKKANETSAATILRNMEFNLDQDPVIDGADDIFDAFHGALPAMGINCYYIGSLSPDGRLSVCDESIGPDATTPTTLGNDLYVTTTYVQDRANIATDVKNIEEALVDGREALARIIYREGENSPIYDTSGVKIGLRSLAKFSTNASATMKDNPLYHMAVYALQDGDGKYLGQDVWEYADTIVQEAFAAGVEEKSPIAAEAAVALNLWMELANELYHTSRNCESRQIFDDDGIHSIDEAVAYWIGDGQSESSDGHLLYALAEKMGDAFSTRGSTGQSNVNVKVLHLFHQAKIELSVPNACSDHETYRRLRQIVTKLTTQMIVVQIQALIHNLRVGDRKRVRVYAHGFVPLVVGCSPSKFSYLREKLLDFTYSDVEVDSIVGAIQSTFSCFSITCNDIGVHSTESSASCIDPEDRAALAGYRPATDVKNYAKLDLDVQELDILLKMKAYGPAENLYAFGKHAVVASGQDGTTTLSLEGIATSTDRSVAPQFADFKQYYGEDDRYADTIIRYALMSNNGLTDDERRLVVTGASQFMILYMAVLQHMQQAVDTCNSGGENSAQLWDVAASWLIGHLEGSSEAGSTEGRLIWSLAKDHCREFNTCSDSVPGSAQVNDQIVLHLFTGRGAALANICEELKATASAIAKLLPVPLIQAALSTAVKLKHSNGQSQRQLLAKGYIYSHAILPLIKTVNAQAAEAIAAGFDLVGGEALPDGIYPVVTAYSSVLAGMGIKCEDVGSSDSINACTGAVYANKGVIVGVVLALVVVAVVGYLFWRRRSQEKRKAENNPLFLKPKGEMNHTPEFSSVDPPSAFDYEEDREDVPLARDADGKEGVADEEASVGSGGDPDGTSEVESLQVV